MEAASAPVKRLQPGRVIGQTFATYRDNLAPLLGSALIVFAFVELVSLLLAEVGGIGVGLVAFFFTLAGQALYTGVVVKLVQDVRDGRRDSTIGDLFSAAAPAILPLVAFTVLYTLGVLIGFLLLVVPGLILVTIWSLGPAAIVIERIGPLAGFGRSYELVKGSGWSVFLVLFVTFVIAAAVGLALALLAVALLFSTESDAAGYFVGLLISALTAPIAALAVAIMYFELGGGRTAASFGSPGGDDRSPSSATEPSA